MYYYIANPAAGSGSVKRIENRLKARLEELNISGELVKTIGPGDAFRIAEKAIAKGYKTIGAIGGNSTVEEIIQAIQTQKSHVALGIIPVGGGNHLARNLGIKDWRGACQILAARRLSEYKLISLGGRTILNPLSLRPKGLSGDNAGFRPGRIFKAASSPLFKYRLEVDDSYRLEGKAKQIFIYNQKLLNSAADNQLLIRIISQSSKIWHTRLAFSQIKASRLKIFSQIPLMGALDQETKELNLELSEQSLRLITP